MVLRYPINDWDRKIMETLPFVMDLKSPRDFNEAKGWAYATLEPDSFTYNGGRFYFKDEEAWMMFSMKWDDAP